MLFKKTNNMSSDIFDAVKNGFFEDVKKFVAQNKASVDSVNKTGWTPLHFAALHDRFEIAEFLIQNGANVCPMIGYRDTPLRVAISAYHTKMAKLLIENGSDVNEQNWAGSTLLHVTAENCDRETFEMLIQYGADPTITDRSNLTPFVYLTDTFHVGFYNVLLENGCISGKKLAGKLTKAARSTN